LPKKKKTPLAREIQGKQNNALARPGNRIETKALIASTFLASPFG